MFKVSVLLLLLAALEFTGGAEIQCRAIDVVLVTDISGSIKRQDWGYHVVPFLKSIVKYFPLDEGKAKIAAVLFAAEAGVFFDFKNYSTRAQIVNEFSTLDHLKCTLPVCRSERFTNTQAGIDMGCSMFDRIRGDRPDVPNVMIVITDGKHTRGKPPGLAADRCRKSKDVSIFAIGVGNYKMDELRAIADQDDSDDRDKYIITVKSFRLLHTALKSLLELACPNINECSSKPCRNGGTCVDDLHLYTCRCPPGYKGRNCEININECASSPCPNGATCIDGINRFTCKCPPGYVGRTCQTDVDECASHPCRNGATCIDLPSKYKCICQTGYQGIQCETNIDDCRSQPCLNGGQCIDLVNSYRCQCKTGFVGTTCEIRCGYQDIALAIDMSLSIGQDNWKQFIIPFLRSVVNQLPLNNGKAQLGTILFASYASELFGFKSYRTHKAVMKEFQSLDYMQCTLPACLGDRYTNTQAGIDTACALFNETRGDRPKVSNTLIVITDGQHNLGTNPSEAADRCRKNTGAVIIAVGVSDFRMSELRGFANKEPAQRDRYVITSRTFANLKNVLPTLLGVTCESSDS